MTAKADNIRYREIQIVLARVLVLNVIVAAGKLIIGLMTGTLAMVADGIHSTIDASSNVVGIIGTVIAARPPDNNHPYGHRRFETIATLAIGIFLLLAAWEILKTAIDRLAGHGEVAEVTPLSFAVMIATMLINIFVTVYETGQGKRLRSDILLADASQTRGDIFISLSVLIGLGVTLLGFPWIDTILASLIVVLIGKTAFEILRKTTDILVDAVAVDPEEVRQVLSDVPGIDHIVRVRSRGPADMIYADIDVKVQPFTTADRSAAIANEIGERVKKSFEGVSEVQVRFEPHHEKPNDYTLVARAAADALGLSIHEVTELLTPQGKVLEMHVEVEPSLSLSEAHEKVSELESRVCQSLPKIHDIVTHIEPASGQPGAVLQTVKATSQRDQAVEIATTLYPDANWHDATIRPVLGGYAITVHCWLPGNVSVQEAHTIAEHVETQIRAALPQVQRVTIHTEPLEEKPS